MADFVVLAQHVCVCCAVGVAALVDARTRIIPHACVAAIVIVRLLAVLALYIGGEDWVEALVFSCVGACALGLPLLVLVCLVGGIGGGDIKLFAALGFVLGWFEAAVVLLVSCVLTVVVGLLSFLIHKPVKKERGLLATTVPMAPQIAVALLVTLNLFKV